jgi:DNA topoisomerase-1
VIRRSCGASAPWRYHRPGRRSGCPDPVGHIQATGRDEKGRKQYRYHPSWREVRDAAKYAHTVDFAQALPGMRARVEQDLRRPGLPLEKVLATVVRLLETTPIRVGNDDYARSNDSYGLATLRNRHVAVQAPSCASASRARAGAAGISA